MCWGGKRLSVVVITWNQCETTRACLAALAPTVDVAQDEIIVIDNGSVDGTGEMIFSEFPAVLYHRVDRNRGVGPARNLGVALSSGRYLMTLDNDALLPPGIDLGTEVENVFRRFGEVGLFGFDLWNEDGTRQSSARRFPRFLNPIAARIPGMKSLPYFRRISAEHLMEDTDFDSVAGLMEVDYVLGANQVFRRAVLANTHAYDPRIFYGPEDYEFCLRIWRTGWSVGWVPAVKIVHEHRRLTRKLSRMTLRFIAAHIYVFLKYRFRVRRSP